VFSIKNISKYKFFYNCFLFLISTYQNYKKKTPKNINLKIFQAKNNLKSKNHHNIKWILKKSKKK